MTPAEIQALVGELLAQARRLGLVWTLQLGTMDGVDTVIVDGDDVPIPVVNLVGAPPGVRVAVTTVPPAGAYITAAVDRPAAANENGFNAALGTGSTTSATPVDMPGTPETTLTKMFASTRIRVDLHTTFFVSNAQAGAFFSVDINGTSYDITRYEDVLPGLNVRLTQSGTAFLDVPDVGDLTVTGQWRRTSGTGTLSTVTADDWYSLAVAEVA